MFKRIEAQLVLCGLTKKELASKIGVCYNTLLQKLNGSSRFTLDEALKIKEVIHSRESVEDLFEKTR